MGMGVTVFPYVLPSKVHTCGTFGSSLGPWGRLETKDMRPFVQQCYMQRSGYAGKKRDKRVELPLPSRKEITEKRRFECTSKTFASDPTFGNPTQSGGCSGKVGQFL